MFNSQGDDSINDVKLNLDHVLTTVLSPVLDHDALLYALAFELLPLFIYDSVGRRPVAIQ